MTAEDIDFCRVCRCEAAPEKPLFHPCLCTGSIKYVHQDCLVQWLHYSRRKTCELCHHTFEFQAVYAPDTPSVVPLGILLAGIFASMRRCLFLWLHHAAALLSWFFVVPVSVYRTYRCLFSGKLSGLLSLPLDILSTDNLIPDCIHGFLLVALALSAVVGYIWLREQIAQAGEPPWLAAHFGEDQGVQANPQPEEPAEAIEVNAAPVSVAMTPPSQAAITPLLDPSKSTNVPTLSAESSRLPQSSGSSTIATSQPSGSSVNVTDSGLQEPGDAPASTDNFGVVPPVPELVVAEPDLANNAELAAGWQAFDDNAGPEAMNWERIFGFDGSMNFVEHVIWLIALNVLFITVFAYFPYYTGQLVLTSFGLQYTTLVAPFDSCACTLVGYILLALLVLAFHTAFGIAQMPHAYHFTGLFYIYVKVTLFAFFELGVFPAFCGFWMDACSLDMFNATIDKRTQVFHQAPLAVSFIHWTMGLIYLFYIASLLLLIRDVVRPGCLWFLHDFNDPDYKPLHDMISLPVHIYVQHLIVNFSLAGISIILLIWIPVITARFCFPQFLPFQLTLAYDSPVDYIFEIILLQVAIPIMLDGGIRMSLQKVFRLWFVVVSWALGLRSYIFGDVPFTPGDIIVMADGRTVPAAHPTRAQTSTEVVSISEQSSGDKSASPTRSESGSASAEQAPQPAEAVAPEPAPQVDEAGSDTEPEFVQYVPYLRPSYFTLRITCAIASVVVSISLGGLFLLFVPIGIGRWVLSGVGFGSPPRHDVLTLIVGLSILASILKAVL